jgi:membrane protease YdiL (CAAX protease family)
MLLSAILLALCLGSLVWFVRNDLAEYRAFKRLTETADRQRQYRAWLGKTFLLFTCAVAVALAILGRLRSLAALPAEFRPLSQSLQLPAGGGGSFGVGLLIGVVGALGGGVVLGLLLSRRRKGNLKPVYAGDIAALLPRNGAETVWTMLLSLNAGVGEELYFRLLLPLLLVSLGSGALTAFVIAGLIFGAVHFYQGIAGIVATTILGAMLAVLYLWTGNVWIAAGAHALLDLAGLVIRPTLRRMMAARGEIPA